MQEETMKDLISNSELENNDSLNIKEEIAKYGIHWKWFLLSAIIALSVAYLYLRFTTPQYSVSNSILIKDNKQSGISTELAAFEDLGIIGNASANSLDNEIEILKSRKIIGRVVDALDLTNSYFLDGKFRRTELYENTPFLIEFIKKDKNLIGKDTTFVISTLNQDKFEIKDIEGNLLTISNFNDTIDSKLGQFKIVPSENFLKNSNPTEIIVSILVRESVINSYKSRININAVGKKSSVLSISLQDASKSKALAVVDELVKQYNSAAKKEKNSVSEKTKEFIDERLTNIGSNLAIVQDNVTNYRTKFGITGLSEEGTLALEAGSSNNEKIVSMQSQLSLASWIQKRLQKQSQENDVLPTNLGFTDAGITSAIEIYNQLVIKKKRLGVTAGNRNPQLIDIQDQIKTLNNNLLLSLENLKESLEIQLGQLEIEANKVTSKISNIPIIERGMIDIERQNKIYSELYSYLLTKKEETSISLAVTVPNAKIIDHAYGSSIPVSPNKKIIYLAGLLLGCIVPFVILYIKNLLDTKIISRKDIEALTSIPFLGDIPSSDIKDNLVVKNNDRSSTSEAFRFIRANIDFILPDTKKIGKTIFVSSTSSNEGKSFVSINLASALALSGKRVLLLGMDFRVPKVTKYLGIQQQQQKGITHFIKDSNLTSKDIVFKLPEIDQLDVIPSGEIPPNPSELVVNTRVKNLFVEVKQNYDFIIVDSAPVNLVSETLLLSKYADMFIYVMRANHTDKRSLVVPEELYKTKKLSKMAIVLNDVDIKTGYGYGGYGGYDYRGGYGYYTDWKKKSWYSRILGRKKKKIG